jgi:predicted acetyltransferase
MTVEEQRPGRTDALALVEVTDDLEEAYLDMVADFEAAGEGYPFNDAALARRDFPAFVRDLRAEARGEGLPPGLVPQTTFVLVRDGVRALGEFRFRPTVPPPYETNNGHAGYNVRPTERRKGYATRGLALVVERARALGLEGLKLPVEGEKPGSVRAIEKNGGRLAHRTVAPGSGDVTAWYWIDLRREGADRG